MLLATSADDSSEQNQVTDNNPGAAGEEEEAGLLDSMVEVEAVTEQINDFLLFLGTEADEFKERTTVQIERFSSLSPSSPASVRRKAVDAVAAEIQRFSGRIMSELPAFQSSLAELSGSSEEVAKYLTVPTPEARESTLGTITQLREFEAGLQGPID